MPKITYDEVKENVEKSGWQLLSTTYVNLKTDLELMCPEGHNVFINYEKWRKKNYECPICKQNQYYHISTNAVEKNGFRILAFDQASITSGWSVFDDNELISYGSQTSHGANNTENIAKTKWWAVSMIEKWNPDLVVIEDIQLQTYKKTADEAVDAVVTYKKLAYLQGVLINYFFENNIPYKIVSPAKWKSFSQIKGNKRTDQKRNAQLKVKSLYDINVSQDESDAILIGRWAVGDNKKTEMIEF